MPILSTYTKKDDNTIIFTEVKPAETIPQEVMPPKDFDYSFLLKQRDDIQAQWNEQLAQKQIEIEEINTKQGKEKAFVEKLILEAGKLGIVAESLPVEVTPLDTPIK